MKKTLLAIVSLGLSFWLIGCSSSAGSSPSAEQPTIRPETGLLARATLDDGQGVLEVDNGSGTDSVFILAGLDEQPLMSAYIRMGESIQLREIPNGTYYLFFSSGDMWNGEVFTENANYQRFDDSLTFSSSGQSYASWKVTLYPVAGGNASTGSVDPSQFPKAK